MRIRFLSVLLCTVLTFSLTACNTKENTTEKSDLSDTTTTLAADTEPATRDVYAMDTYMTLTAYGTNGEQALDAAEEYITDLDNKLSVGNADSEVSQLNANGTYTFSEMPAEIMNRALEIYEMTEGAFNPLMYPIMDAWGFTTQEYRIPEQSELDTLLQHIDANTIDFDATTGAITLNDADSAVDLGGIAKGYTSAGVMDIFEEYGITSGMVSLGGNVQLKGNKPDGSLWKVGIQNPDLSGNYLAILSLADKAVITSGGYERYFEEDGVTYHHIIDPDTGYPAENGLASVTIITEDGTLADGLSTALFVMGTDKAIPFWQEHSDLFDMVLYTDDGKLYVSEGVAGSLTSDLSYEIVEAE